MIEFVGEGVGWVGEGGGGGREGTVKWNTCTLNKLLHACLFQCV